MGTYSGPPTPPQTLVYRPGGIANGNVFTTFASAVAAAQTAKPSTIVIDDRFGAPVAPAGAWDLDDIFLRNKSGTFPILTFQNGATVTGLSNVAGMILSSESAAPVIVVPSTNLSINLDQSAAIQSSGAPFIRVTAASGLLLLSLRFYSYLFSNGGKAIESQAGATAILFADVGASIYDNCLTGAGSILVQDLTNGAGDAIISHTQAGASDIIYV